MGVITAWWEQLLVISLSKAVMFEEEFACCARYIYMLECDCLYVWMCAKVHRVSDPVNFYWWIVRSDGCV